MQRINKKGFTLIELLAVIVILAILITVSVPAITRYLATARKDTYATNAATAISAVRNDVIVNGVVSKDYTFDEINNLLESGKKLNKSPYGNTYSNTSYVRVTYNSEDDSTIYSICLVDTNGAGIPLTNETALDSSVVATSGVTCARSTSEG